MPGLWFPTERAWYARAEGVDLDGKEVVVEGEELMARCIQHECDHLEGHLYLDRLDRQEPSQGDEGAASAGTVTSPRTQTGWGNRLRDLLPHPVFSRR